ncbi:MAG: hypothetical protein KA327_12455, partial [Pseudarcicella sp.]|nr:hypothetical protein [Pseudarcicella sp.]
MNNKLSQISILGLGLITYSFFACNQTVTPAAQDEITFQCDSLTKDLETLNNVTGIVKSAKRYKEYITVGEPKVIYVIELQKGG